MILLKLNTSRIVFVASAMFIALFLLVSSVCYAGVTVETSTIEVQCGGGFMSAPSFKKKGNPYIKLKVETIGVREGLAKEVIETKKVDIGNNDKEIRMQGGSGLPAHILAICIPSGDNTRISATGESHVCNKGEGIEVSMLHPNSKDPDKFHAVLTLTKFIDDEINTITERTNEVCQDISNMIEDFLEESQENTTKEEDNRGTTEKKASVFSQDNSY